MKRYTKVVIGSVLGLMFLSLSFTAMSVEIMDEWYNEVVSAAFTLSETRIALNEVRLNEKLLVLISDQYKPMSEYDSLQRQAVNQATEQYFQTVQNYNKKVSSGLGKIIFVLHRVVLSDENERPERFDPNVNDPTAFIRS